MQATTRPAAPSFMGDHLHPDPVRFNFTDAIHDERRLELELIRRLGLRKYPVSRVYSTSRSSTYFQHLLSRGGVVTVRARRQ